MSPGEGGAQCVDTADPCNKVDPCTTAACPMDTGGNRWRAWEIGGSLEGWR